MIHLIGSLSRVYLREFQEKVAVITVYIFIVVIEVMDFDLENYVEQRSRPLWARGSLLSLSAAMVDGGRCDDTTRGRRWQID